MTDTYSYTRFRWRKEGDLEKIASMLEKKFKVVRRAMPTSEHDISPYKDLRVSLIVKADTLDALITPLRATLSQREKKAFTAKDMELRQLILDTFPHSSSTFFPWGFSVEPPFDTE
jgi:hypothetical protein